MNKEYDRKKVTLPFKKAKRYAKEDWILWQTPTSNLFSNLQGETMYERLIEWLQNFKVNLETIGFDHCVSELPQIKGSALIVDKSMASTQYFKQLPNLQKYKGVIICCDRALPSLIENKIIPTYVVNVDASYLCQYFFDVPHVKEAMPKIKGIFAVTTHPLTIRLWHGPQRYFFTPYLESASLTRTMMLKSKTIFSHTAGQVASTAWIIAYNLGAKNIGVLGVTHSYDSLDETEYPSIEHKRFRGKYGVCWADPVYQYYNDIFLNLIEHGKKRGVQTVNCSQAGILYSKYVDDMTLQEFVEKYQ